MGGKADAGGAGRPGHHRSHQKRGGWSDGVRCRGDTHRERPNHPLGQCRADRHPCRPRLVTSAAPAPPRRGVGALAPALAGIAAFAVAARFELITNGVFPMLSLPTGQFLIFAVVVYPVVEESSKLLALLVFCGADERRRMALLGLVFGTIEAALKAPVHWIAGELTQGGVATVLSLIVLLCTVVSHWALGFLYRAAPKLRSGFLLAMTCHAGYNLLCYGTFFGVPALIPGADGLPPAVAVAATLVLLLALFCRSIHARAPGGGA